MAVSIAGVTVTVRRTTADSPGSTIPLWFPSSCHDSVYSAVAFVVWTCARARPAALTNAANVIFQHAMASPPVIVPIQLEAARCQARRAEATILHCPRQLPL